MEAENTTGDISLRFPPPALTYNQGASSWARWLRA